MEDIGIQSAMGETKSREKVRESIFFSASVCFVETNETVSVRVRNISTGGMMIDCSIGAKIGDEIVAEIKNVGRIRGHVAWSVSPRLGIAFDREIDPKMARVKV